MNNFKRKDIEKDQKSITIQKGSRTYILNFDEIIDFQMTGINHKIRVTTLNSQIEFYGKLKDLSSVLDKRFYQSHRACLINTDYIQMINKDPYDLYILMKNGQKSLLSRSGLKGLTAIV
ncbi:LytTR family DNA-binding domain-containing protein [Inediibacterium massiliense]|uniref:LytTR family DNA-binding domain-containing protein n=1 Tax=Inediibacterium massiliense TaxID=1658111 RepID=UPI0018FE3A2C|nr:LytTR family DNA-binding domain-containing protein [Inediibacterium massiliense]